MRLVVSKLISDPMLRSKFSNSRLYTSFPINSYRHLSKTFSVSLSHVVGRLFVDCKAPEQMKKALDFITDPINRFRRHMFSMFRIFGPPPVDIAACIPSGPHAMLFLLIGRTLEFFVDAVVFFDIFVWYLTGDVDETHAIIP